MRVEGRSPRTREKAAGDYCVVSERGGLAALAFEGVILVIEQATGEERRRFPGHGGRVVAFDRTGEHLFTGDGRGTLQRWNLHTGALSASNEAFTTQILSITTSPDQSRVLVTGLSGMMIHEATTLDPLISLVGHENYVRSARFSHDGRRIASASGDHTARLWVAVLRHVRQDEVEKWTAARQRMAATVERSLAESATPEDAWSRLCASRRRRRSVTPYRRAGQGQAPHAARSALRSVVLTLPSPSMSPLM